VDIILWMAQALLAAAFSLAGLMKVQQPLDELRKNLGPWVDGFSLGQIRTIGTFEILGALGLILPMWLNILPVMTPIAAIGIGIIMIGAIITHLKMDDSKPAMANFILLLLCVFVAIGRLGHLPAV